MTLALEMANQRAEGKEEGRVEGKFETLKELVRDGLLTIREAAERAGLSEEMFRKQAML